MRGKIAFAGFILGLAGIASSAQSANPPFPNNVYCSGIVTSEAVPRDTYVVSGEQADTQVVFNQNQYIFISRGTSKGVKVGDEFSVIRPVEDAAKVEWTKWQDAILHKMGTVWEDEGRVKVVDARPDVSVAQIEHVCGYVQRADVLLPFVARPEPPLKDTTKVDRFAPLTGKSLAMIISSPKFVAQVGKNDFIYVNLGNSQGVKVGDYFRIFRYTGAQHETAYQTRRFAFDVDGDLGPTYGYGAAGKKWDWNNTPREVLGEGVVTRIGPNSSTVLITFSTREIYAGDYVELE
ncbi:MAG TPA: hypothetical protein VG322_07300 [Candidatus Acidoferrales bacterium]|jgi:hypothetical protein|nr:hypothetical protein [Candidatus Acidoferrales bacterium]